MGVPPPRWPVIHGHGVIFCDVGVNSCQNRHTNKYVYALTNILTHCDTHIHCDTLSAPILFQVDGTGQVRVSKPGDAEFQAMVGGLGVYGIVTE